MTTPEPEGGEKPWSVKGVPPGAAVAIERVCGDCGGRFMDTGLVPNRLCPPCAHKPENQRHYALVNGKVEIRDGRGTLLNDYEESPDDPT